MKIKVTENGVFADGAKINNVTRVDVINLNPIENMEVVLHIAASEIEVSYRKLGVRDLPHSSKPTRQKGDQAKWIWH